MTNINVCFLGDDSSAKTLVGNLLCRYNKDIDYKTKDYSNIIDTLENERTEITDKSNLIWSFIIKNKQFNISFVNKKNGIDKTFFRNVSSCDIAFIIFDSEQYTEKLSSNLKHKLFLVNVLGIKNIVVFLDNFNQQNTLNVKKKLTNMLKKRKFKDNKIIFYNLNNSCIPNHIDFIKTLSTIRIPNKSKKDLILPINKIFNLNDRYLAVNGRLLSGELKLNETITLNPENIDLNVLEIQKNHNNIQKAIAGDNIGIRFEHNNCIQEGMILTKLGNDLGRVTNITCQFVVMNKNTIPVNMECMLYCNFIEVSCVIKNIYKTIDKDNKTLKKKPDELENGDNSIINIELRKPISITTYKSNNKLGSFVLMSKDDNENILGVGLVKTAK